MAKTKKTKFKLEPQTAQFVLFSDVFFGLDLARNAFSESDPDASYGNNNRTLVTPNTISDALDNMTGDDDTTDEQIDEVKERLDSLPPDVYVDLEN